MTTKPQAIALLGFAERSLTIPDPAVGQDVIGPTIDTGRLSGALMVISSIASIAGAGASIEVVVEDSAGSTAWAEVVRFPARVAVTDPPDVQVIDRVGRYVRARLEISGDAGVTIRTRNEAIGLFT